MEAVALFSFAASEADEISFHRGDIIKVSVCMRGEMLKLTEKLHVGKVKPVTCVFLGDRNGR